MFWQEQNQLFPGVIYSQDDNELFHVYYEWEKEFIDIVTEKSKLITMEYSSRKQTPSEFECAEGVVL